MEEQWLKRNTDCVYFLTSPLTCKKGIDCEYRHSEIARLNPRAAGTGWLGTVLIRLVVFGILHWMALLKSHMNLLHCHTNVLHQRIRPIFLVTFTSMVSAIKVTDALFCMVLMIVPLLENL